MKIHDYVPYKDGVFLTWMKHLVDYAKLHGDEWGISADVWVEIDAQSGAYETALGKAQDPNRGKIDVFVKNETRDTVKKTMRQFVQEYLRHNHRVSDEDLDRMGLPVYDKKLTSRPRPESRATLSARASNSRQHILFALSQQTGKKTKPADAYIVKYVWEIRDTAPTSPDELRHAFFSRRTTHIFDYDEADRGKKVYYAVRYENAKGEEGPWSEMICLLIP